MDQLATTQTTWDELTSHALARHRFALEDRGWPLEEADVVAINAHLALTPFPLSVPQTDPRYDELLVYTRHRAIRDAMSAVAEPIIAAGGRAPLAAPGTGPAALLDPVTYPSGLVLQAAFEEALHRLDELARLDEIAAQSRPDEAPRRVDPFGVLFTEAEVADLLRCSVPVLRAWRARRIHLTFLKWPGPRGLVRYTESAIRDLIGSVVQTVDGP